MRNFKKTIRGGSISEKHIYIRSNTYAVDRASIRRKVIQERKRVYNYGNKL